MNNTGNDYISKTLKKIWGCIIAITIMTSMNTIILLSNNSLYNSNDNEGNQEINEDYDVSAFTLVSANELVNKTKDKTSVIYIGRASCSWCAKFVPILTEATEQYDLNTLYIDISKIIDFSVGSITDQASYDIMMELETASGLEDYMEKEFGATPMVLIIKDGKILDAVTGYQELTQFSEFLEKNGFEK